MSTLLGSLLVKLSLDNAEFERGSDRSVKSMGRMEGASANAGHSFRDFAGALAEVAVGSTKVQEALRGLADKVTNLGKAVASTGVAMTKSLTLPIAGIGVAVIKVAADFETGMNRVQIATGATAAEMADMRKLALAIGKDTTFGASEAASAMEMLSKAGIDTTTILGGAAKAVTNLAAAAGSELDPAASAISDSINQFHLAAKDLPLVVNQITGAVNESKFEFSDFTDGMAQGGGVAASAGLSFEEFAGTLAAVSSQFASGSDAGTSFKTFLLALTPTTKKAAEAMAQYGLVFYDAQGQLKPMADIAEMLRVKFAGLSDETRNAAFKDIFGTDSIRVAVGLMNQGADGIERIQKALTNTNAADQAAKRMAGFAGQLEQLKGALETLAIAIADTGLLTAITSLVKHVADFISGLSQTHPAILKVAVSLAVFAAAAGPVLAILGTLASTVLPFLLVRLGPIALAISALINPLGTVIALVARFAGGAIAMTALRGAFAAVAAVASSIAVPLAVVAAVGALIYANWDKIAPVLEEFWQAAQEALGPPIRELVTTLSRVLSELWNGPLGDALRAVIGLLGDFIAIAITAFGAVFVRMLQVALSVVIDVLEQIGKGIRFVNAVLNGDWRQAWQLASGGATSAIGVIHEALLTLLGPIGLVIRGLERIWGLKPKATGGESLQGSIAGMAAKGFNDARDAAKKAIEDAKAAPAASPPSSGGGAGSKKTGGGSAGRSAKEIESQFNAEILQYAQRISQADSDRARNAEEAAEYERKGVEYARRETLNQLKNNEDYNGAQKERLAGVITELADAELERIERDKTRRLEQETQQLADARFGAERDGLQVQMELADNQADRKRIALQLLDAEREHLKASLEAVIASQTIADADKERAQIALDALNANAGAQREAVSRQNETNGERFTRELNPSAGALNDAIDQIKIDGLNTLNDGLVDAIVNFRSLGDVARSVLRQILGDLLSLQIRKAIISPLANALGLGGGKAAKIGGDTGGLEANFDKILGGGADSAGLTAAGSTLTTAGTGLTAAATQLTAAATALSTSATAGQVTGGGGGLLKGLLGVAGAVAGSINFGSAAAAGANAVGSSVVSGASAARKLKFFASGTNFAPGGLAIVGERGPELVNLRRGSQVIPNHELKGMGRQGDTYNIQVAGSGNEARDRATGRQVYSGIAQEQAKARRAGLAA